MDAPIRGSNFFPASVGAKSALQNDQPGRGDKHLNHRNVSNKSALKDDKNVLRQVPRKISCKVGGNICNERLGK